MTNEGKWFRVGRVHIYDVMFGNADGGGLSFSLILAETSSSLVTFSGILHSTFKTHAHADTYTYTCLSSASSRCVCAWQRYPKAAYSESRQPSLTVALDSGQVASCWWTWKYIKELNLKPLAHTDICRVRLNSVHRHILKLNKTAIKSIFFLKYWLLYALLFIETNIYSHVLTSWFYAHI